MPATKKPSTLQYFLLGLTGAGMLACFIAMSTLTHFTRQGYRFLTYFLIAFVLYLVALIFISWRPNNKALLGLIFTLAIAYRIPLWFSEPTLSTDIWRYLWDGHLLTNGVNPYAERVDSPALDPLSTPLRSRVNHQWMATPYPPVAEVAFAGTVALMPDSPRAIQIIFTVFDLATAVIVVLILRRLNLPDSRVLFYVWNPLIVVEFAHSAHVDSLMTLFVMLAIYWLISEHKMWSAVALALAVLTKFLPLLLVPIFNRRWGIWRTLFFGLLVLIGFAPFLGAGLGLNAASDGTGIFGALRIYTAYWKTNDGLFFWLVRALEPYAQYPVNVARGISLVVLLAMGLWVFLRSKPEEDSFNHQSIIDHAVLLIGIYLLFQAAMFPWYLTWLIAFLPMLCFRQQIAGLLYTIGWIYFSAAVNLSYLFYLDPDNTAEIEWIRRVEYLPLFALLSAALFAYLWQKFKQARSLPQSPSS